MAGWPAFLAFAFTFVLSIQVISGQRASPNPAAKSCTTDVTFEDAPKKYNLCSPLKNGASIAWNLTTSSMILDLHFETVGSSSSESIGWVSWGISPTGRMPKSSAVGIFPSPNGPKIVQYKLPAYKSPKVGGNLTILHQKAEILHNNNLYKVELKLQLLSNESQIFQVWGKGPSADPNTDVLAPHVVGYSFGSSQDFLTGSTGSAIVGSHQKFKNTHSVLNVISWGLLIPLGTFFPRYGKPFFPTAWFYLHMPIQIAGYIIGVVGFGFGLRLIGWDSVPRYTHRILGILIFAFATLQIFALVLRPSTKSSLRGYWNVYHHTGGYAVVVLSIINVFYGFHILVTYGNWRTVYIVLISILAAFALILEGLTWFVYFNRKGQVGLNGSVEQMIPSEKAKYSKGTEENGTSGAPSSSY